MVNFKPVELLGFFRLWFETMVFYDTHQQAKITTQLHRPPQPNKPSFCLRSGWIWYLTASYCGLTAMYCVRFATGYDAPKCPFVELNDGICLLLCSKCNGPVQHQNAPTPSKMVSSRNPAFVGLLKLHPRLSINLSTLADLYLSFFIYIILPYLIDFLHHSLSICYIVIRPYLILAFLSRIFYQCISSSVIVYLPSSWSCHRNCWNHDHATGTA